MNAKDAINYQAIVRDPNSKLLSLQNISVQLSIYKDIQNQNMVFQENHFTQTNALGMINLKIGLGQVVSGSLDTISWGSGTYYLQAGVDLAGGTNFLALDTTQILYVPYAYYAKKTRELDLTNMSDSLIKDIAAKLNLKNKQTTLEKKVTNFKYIPVAENKDIVVYQCQYLYGVEAALGKIVVMRNTESQFDIGENGIDSTYATSVTFNITNFPNLLPFSTIEKILLLPWYRNPIQAVPSAGWRCCVITSKGQVYHNFPNRTPEFGLPDGIAQAGDINRWQESVVWDLPKRRLPSKTSNVFPYTLNPALPDSCYIPFPAVSQDNMGYGNGGFGISTTQLVSGQPVQFPRFYLHKRSSNHNPLVYMSGFETSNTIQVIGTYNPNDAANNSSRICVFASSDGGRQWYNKYEFASNMSAAFGNALIGTNITGNYKQNDFSFQKRDFVIPTSAVKNPVNIFSYGPQINIQNIQKSTALVINTIGNHGLESGDLIVIKKNQTTSPNFDFLCNDNINTTNGGNGKVWKVEVISSNSFKLYEYIHNPDSNIPVRHIHAVNHMKDGFMITTGEIYPQSWLIHLQLANSDIFSNVQASDNFPFIRLNSSENSVQRTLGAFMLDDADHTIVYASDEASLTGGALHSVPGRTNLSFSRSSTGIFKGKLADIDDFSKFTCIYEAEQTAVHFKEKNGMWIFGGQQAELVISLDKGSTWKKYSFTGTRMDVLYPKGVDNLGRYFLDQVIIYRK